MKDNSGKIILALLAGASAGVIAGLLMAPDSGENTRGSLKKYANKLSKDLEGTLQSSLSRLEGMGLGNLMGKPGNDGGSTTTSNAGAGAGTAGTEA